MGIAKKMRCLLGKHERDRSRVRYDGTMFRSPCVGCGSPMARNPMRGWELSDSDG